MSNKYTPTHRGWDHVGNLVPNWEHSEGIRPAMYGIPAPWLPIQYQDKHYEVYITVMPGRPVGLTCDGFLVPAGLKVAWTAAAGGATILTYTADDVAELVTDLTTGLPVTAATSYTKTAVQTALRSRGLIDAAEVPQDYVSYPVGVASHAFYVWSSNVDLRQHSNDLKTFNPADFKFHNFRMQHQVQILCDYTIRLPWLASDATTEVLAAALTGGTPAYGADVLVSSTDVSALARYSDLTGTNFIAWIGPDAPVAKDSVRTPISADNASLFVRERSGPDQLTTAGDFFIDHAVGIWFFFVSGGATVPAHVNGTTVTYNEYTTSPASVGDYVSVAGDIKPGSFVETDGDSNFVVSTSSDPRVIMGQVLGFVKHPKDFLGRVKTRYKSLGTVNKMPGSATAGVPDTLNVTETGSETEVIINLITR